MNVCVYICMCIYTCMQLAYMLWGLASPKFSEPAGGLEVQGRVDVVAQSQRQNSFFLRRGQSLFL